MPKIIIEEVPQKSFDVFMKIAKDNFDGNVSMCFQSLLDHAVSFYSVSSAIDELYTRVSRLEKGEKPKEITTVNGKKITLRKR